MSTKKDFVNYLGENIEDQLCSETDSHGLMCPEDKVKLAGIETGATKNIVDSALNTTSTNAIQNSVVTTELNTKPGKIVKTVTDEGTKIGETFNDGQNHATGDWSHAEGFQTDATSDYSHSEGNNTTASGEGSHAEGNNTTASGEGSHAEGNNTTASGDYSHSSGQGTIAAAAHQTVIGRFNELNTAPAFIIGNGTSNINRSTAFHIDWAGNIWISNTDLETVYNKLQAL